MMKISTTILAILLLAATIGCSRTTADPSSDEPDITVRTQTARQRTIAQWVTGLGRCEALPNKRAVLTAAVEGRVVQLLAQPGATIHVSQEIVRLDPAVAQANLDEKKAARDAQLASLKLLESMPRAEEQNSAKLAIEQAKLALAKSRATVDHLRPLRQKNDVSAAALYEAEVALQQSQLQLKTAESQYEVLMLKPRREAIEEAQSRVIAMEAAVATAQKQLDLHTIRSPIEGVLDSLAGQLGQTLSVGATVGEVVDSKQLHAVVWLSIADAQLAKLGQTAQVQLGGSKTGNSATTSAPTVAGQVVFIGSVADPQTGNLPLRLLVDNASRRLTLGQVVSATIRVNEKNTLAVPIEAVHDLGEGPVLSVIRDGKTVLLHPTLGFKDSQWIEVSATDLKPGESVVVEGGYHLPEGTKVAVEPAIAASAYDAPEKEPAAGSPSETKR